MKTREGHYKPGDAVCGSDMVAVQVILKFEMTGTVRTDQVWGGGMWDCGGAGAIRRMICAGKMPMYGLPLLTLATAAGALALLEAGTAITALTRPSTAASLAKAGVESIVLK